jgi:type VI secretion system secreted protein VgrG
VNVDISAILIAVAGFNQDRRLIRVKTTLEADVLMVHRVSGSETVSQPFDLTVDLLSPYAALELKSMIGQPILLTMDTPAGVPRYFHGYVREFSRTDNEGGFARYQAKISPWFWFLSHRTNCRIFQDLSVVDIAEKIFGEHGALAKYDFAALDRGRYPAKPYCVQYNESDFAFISRLLADVGIHYRFEHTEEDHSLVASDDSTQCPPQLGDPQIRFHSEQGAFKEQAMVVWTTHRSVAPAAFSLKTFDQKQPTAPLAATVDNMAIPRGLLPPFERYIYDGAAAYLDTGTGEQRAAIRMEEATWRTKLFAGQGSSRLMQAGRYFQLNEHYEHNHEEAEDRQFFVISVKHDAHNNFVKDFTASEGSVYVGQVTCVRRKIAYRPDRLPPRRMPGLQSATVVGPPGEEIYADKAGRVKVQFHWDREGKSDQSSSCYLRVATPWAGEGMGAVSVPRIGQEVLVDYLEGNPDCPIIVGRVYNAHNMPPINLDVSGFKTKTHKGSGFNELTMCDTDGAQRVNVQAERNMDTLVKNDQSNIINNNKATAVANNHTESVGVNQTVTVGANQDSTVKANRSATVIGNDTRTVSGNGSSTVTGDVTQTYLATQTRAVTSHYTETIGGNWTSGLTGNYDGGVTGNWAQTVVGTTTSIEVGAVTHIIESGRDEFITGKDNRNVNGPVTDANKGLRSISVTGNLDQGASGTCDLHSDGVMTVASAAQVVHAVAASSITIDGASIVIVAGGSTIKVDAGGVTVNGAKINLNC